VKLIRAFILGCLEWRQPYGTSITTFRELEAYELGAMGTRRFLGRIMR
jgi:hypothetical protein